MKDFSSTIPAKIMSRLLLSFILVLLALSSLSFAKGSFNIEIELPKSYQTVHPGDEVLFTIKLTNLYNEEHIDVTITYSIETEEGSTLTSRSKTVAIGTQASFAGSLKLPPDAKEGKYLLKTRVVPVKAENINPAESEITLYVSKSKKISEYKNTLESSDYVRIFILTIIILSAVLILKNKKLVQKAELRIKIKRIVSKKIKNKK